MLKMHDVYIILCNFGVRTISGFKVKDGASPPLTPLPPPRSQQAKKSLALNRVSTCLADSAVVTELIITGSTCIAEPRVTQAEGQLWQLRVKKPREKKKLMKTIKIKINKQTNSLKEL